ncbi:MAG: response regulator, partial [Spirochaetia bacterium]|nr:response regulator [Spirochaetia bacterium]
FNLIYFPLVTLAVATLNGVAAQYLWLNSPEWNNRNTFFFTGLSVALSVFHAVKFLDTSHYFPLFNRVMLWIIFAGLYGAMFSLLGDIIITRWFLIFVLPIGVISTFILSLYSFARKIPNANLYFLSILMFPVFVLFFQLSRMGLIPVTSFTEYSVPSGIMLQLITLSIVVAYKNRQLDKVNQELHLSDRLKTDFFANVSHDLKTPLTLILSPLENILSSKRNAVREDVIQDLTLMQKNGKKLLELIRNILDSSQIREYGHSLNLKKTNLVSFIQNIAEPFRLVAENKGLSFKLNSSSKFIELDLDSEKMESVFYNLIGNALKYTDKGAIEISILDGPKEIAIKIVDTGSGIPSFRQNKIFKRFIRGAFASSEQAEGSGIGLALCREFVEIQKGRIEVSSKPGEGSCFTITFPKEIQKWKFSLKNRFFSREGNGARAADIELKKSILKPNLALVSPEFDAASLKKILIVEDNPEMLEFIHSLLADKFQVIKAEHGIEALKKIRSDKPDLVLSDVMMPEMDGIELLKAFKSDPYLQEIPFILLTAKSEVKDKIEGIACEAEDYITKPFHPEELIERINNRLRKRVSQLEKIQAEKKNIYANIHDLLGARITDLTILIRSLNAQEVPDSNLVMRMNDHIRSIAFELKNWLPRLEDLDLLESDFFDGLQLQLIRRYSNASRKLKFTAQDDVQMILKDGIYDIVKNAMLHIVTEIATNDLKYGNGRSLWNFDFQESDPRQVSLSFEAETSYSNNEQGRGTENIERMVREIGGTVSMEMEDTKIKIFVLFPLELYSLQDAL